MDIPVKDAVTVAYVAVVHAISELNEISGKVSGAALDDLQEALMDLNTAKIFLRGHCNEQ